MDNNEIVPGFDDEKDDSLRIRLQNIESIPGCLLLYLWGYVDMYNSNYFQKRVAKAIETGFIRLIFNRDGYNEVSSCGIGSFTAFLKAVRPRGGDLVILKIQPKVLEVWHLLGFAEFFNIRDTIGEAIDFFMAAAEKGGLRFPGIFRCPSCERILMASKMGRFRCSECKAILIVDESGICLG